MKVKYDIVEGGFGNNVGRDVDRREATTLALTYAENIHTRMGSIERIVNKADVWAILLIMNQEVSEANARDVVRASDAVDADIGWGHGFKDGLIGEHMLASGGIQRRVESVFGAGVVDGKNRARCTPQGRDSHR